MSKSVARRATAALVTAVVALTAACGSSSNTSSSSSGSSSSPAGGSGSAGSSAATPSSGGGGGGGQTLVVYSADPANTATYQSLVNTFGAKNGVSVKIISYPSADFLKNFSSAVTGRSQVDVLLANGQDVRYLKSKNLLADITGVADTADLVGQATQPFTIDGKLYAVGTGTLSTTALVYNPAVFKKYGLTIPKTFADLQTDADKLKGTGVSLISVPGGNIYLWPIWLMQMLQQTSGNDPVTLTQNTLKAGSPDFTAKPYVDALTAMQKLGSMGVFGNGFNGVTQDAAVAQFVQQKAAMFYGGTWDLATIAKQGSALDATPLAFPTFVDGAKQGSSGGVGIAAAVYAHADPARAELDRKLAAYLASADADNTIVTAAGSGLSLPAVKSVKSALNSTLQTQIVSTFVPSTFTFLDWYWPKEVTAVFQNGVQAVVAGQQSPEDVAKAAQAAFTAAKAAGWTYN